MDYGKIFDVLFSKQSALSKGLHKFLNQFAAPAVGFENFQKLIPHNQRLIKAETKDITHK